MGRKSVLPDGQRNETSRVWVFTFYREDDVARLKSVPHVGYACAREKGSTSKMEHYQGVIKFENYKQSSWWFNQFKGYAESPTETGDDGTPKRYWNWWKPTSSESLARLYVVDALRWVEIARGQENWHEKEQGEVLDDYGLQVYTADRPDDDREARVCDMIYDGAQAWQIAREFPRYYFRRRRAIVDVIGDVAGWREQGVDYRSSVRTAIKEPLPKRRKTEKSGDGGTDGTEESFG